MYLTWRKARDHNNTLMDYKILVKDMYLKWREARDHNNTLIYYKILVKDMYLKWRKLWWEARDHIMLDSKPS